MSLPIDERQPIPSVRTVATLINGGAVYAPSASPLKAGVGAHDDGDQNDLLAQMLACAQACAFSWPSASRKSRRLRRCAWPACTAARPGARRRACPSAQALAGRCAGRNKEDAASLLRGLQALRARAESEARRGAALAAAQARSLEAEAEAEAHSLEAQLAAALGEQASMKAAMERMQARARPAEARARRACAAPCPALVQRSAPATRAPATSRCSAPSSPPACVQQMHKRSFFLPPCLALVVTASGRTPHPPAAPAGRGRSAVPCGAAQEQLAAGAPSKAPGPAAAQQLAMAGKCAGPPRGWGGAGLSRCRAQSSERAHGVRAG